MEGFNEPRVKRPLELPRAVGVVRVIAVGRRARTVLSCNTASRGNVTCSGSDIDHAHKQMARSIMLLRGALRRRRR